ncbi:MAG: hypothetical protein B7Y49_12750, partial [Sphingomonas sp. 28-62-11]
MMCKQVWGCTNNISSVFSLRLQQPPSDIEALRVLVRHLREDLSFSVSFIEAMRDQPLGYWHNADLFTPFLNWAVIVSAMWQQLDDLNHSINY